MFVFFVMKVPQANYTDTSVTCALVVSENMQTVSSQFVYDPALTATVTGVSPVRGGTGGGTTLTITGTAFP